MFKNFYNDVATDVNKMSDWILALMRRYKFPYVVNAIAFIWAAILLGCIWFSARYDFYIAYLIFTFFYFISAAVAYRYYRTRKNA